MIARSAHSHVPRKPLLLFPLVGAALVCCTTGDLDSLGAGPTSPDDTADSGGKSPGTGAASMDASTQSAGDSSSPPGNGSPPPSDGGLGLPPPADASDAGDAASTVPASAAAIYLDAGVAGWCATHLGLNYVFCADFDETPLPAGFNASDGAFLTQTSSTASSGPNDLLLYVPPQTSTDVIGSKLSRSFDTPATTLVLAFDVDPEQLNSGAAGLLFAALDFVNNDAAKYSLRLAWNSGAPRLEESFLSGSDIFHSNFTLPLGTWSRVEVDITLPGADGGGAATESILVNGTLQGTSETLSPPTGFDARPNLLVGAVYGTGPTSGWAIRYDNVILDLH